MQNCFAYFPCTSLPAPFVHPITLIPGSSNPCLLLFCLLSPHTWGYWNLPCTLCPNLFDIPQSMGVWNRDESSSTPNEAAPRELAIGPLHVPKRETCPLAPVTILGSLSKWPAQLDITVGLICAWYLMVLPPLFMGSDSLSGTSACWLVGEKCLLGPPMMTSLWIP